jgi:DNA polymerase-3 subunit gamma/tau
MPSPFWTRSFPFPVRDAGDGSIKEIGEEDALAILGVVPVESFIKQLQNVLSLDAAAAMDEVERVVTIGADIPRYVDGFLEIIRTLRLIKNNVSLQELLGLSAEEVAMLKDVADGFYEEELSIIFRIIDDLQRNLKFSNNERINLEMAILDMINIKKAPSLSSIIKKLEGNGVTAGPPGVEAKAEKKPAVSAKKKAVTPPVEKAPQKVNAAAAGSARDIQNGWVTFLNAIKDSKQYLHFVLKAAVITLKDNKLMIQYPAGTDHAYYTRILDRDNLSFVEKEMSSLMGVEISVDVGEVKGEGTASSSADSEGPAPEEGMPQPAVTNDPEDSSDVPLPDAEMLSKPEVDDFERVDPTVEKIKNVFHGQIIEKGES